MPRSTRASAEELEDRISLVCSLIDRGLNQAEVWQYVDDLTDWNISRQQCHNYYHKAYEKMADDAALVSRAAYFTRSLNRLDYIYKKAVGENDLTNARKSTEEVVKLLRLDTPGADFDWTQAAANSGIKPKELKERLKNLMIENDDESEDLHNGTHG